MAELSDSEKKRRKKTAKKLKKSILELHPMKTSERSAIAIKYDIEKDAAPVILAVGKGTFAEEILKVAEDNKIPLFEDKNLANLLIKLEVDTEVPAELYTLVAEVLAFVFRLDQMVSKRKRFEKKASQLEKE